MKKSKSIQLNCFSPPVMIATMTVESVLTIYSFWRYKLDDITRLVLLTLVSLASFQLAEYHVCTGINSQVNDWSRFGFVMISALPPLAIHLMHKLANKPIGNIVYGCYAAMASYVVFFLSYRSAFIGHQCTGNYVIFQMGSKLGGAYGIYYYLLLVLGIGLGVKWANEFKNKSKSYDRLQTIRGLILSYFIFLIPTALANTVSVQSRQAIPSVMCGFAVLYALLLVFYITPKVATVKDVDGQQLNKA